MSLLSVRHLCSFLSQEYNVSHILLSFMDATSEKEETYRHLSIDIVPSKTSQASVENGLTNFFEAQVREIKCDECVAGTHAFQTLHILSQ